MHTSVPTSFSPRLLFAAVLLPLAAACAGEPEPEVAPIDLPEGVSPVAADARLAMPASDDPRCQPGSMRKVFREQSEWDGYWTFGLKEGCPRPALPEGFDFSREMVVMASMGRRESAADSIRVVGTGVVGDSVLVVVDRTIRDGACPGDAGVRTWPRDLLRVPADARPARFVERRRKVPCPGAAAE